MNTDSRKQIQTALGAFSGSYLRDAAIGLLSTLGYQSEKTLDLGGSPKAFLDQFDNNPDQAFPKNKAFFGDWEEIHLLFQLTDEELSGQRSLFSDTGVKQGLMSSYLFFALRLTGDSYARGKLAQITRQLNRLFPMPVMVLFEYGEQLSIAVINRRQSKRDADKDVLGKVTLIREISLTSPHRGHLDILDSFSLSTLAGRNGIHSVDALHAAWEEIFNVELLNKKFYRELSSWYFWAMQHVYFPSDNMELDKGNLFKNDEKIKGHDAKNLIRLLTRLLFVWFIKEKGLIPETLFDPEKLEQDLLKDFDARSGDTRFYKAILQNLFFATLNQTCGKRQFRNQGRQHHNITTLMRYERFFRDSGAFIELVESAVPFMNGGLFDCLDKAHPTRKGRQGGDLILYEDGFSDRDDNMLKVPDFLFFGKEEIIDLSGVLGDKKRTKEKVRGIIHIFNSYKFTIDENTPIEQEIALDPELLGKVFENLLASYNPETKTTARKQTGSFYTPRSIVDFMVDKSLKAYLKKELCAACPEVTDTDADVGLNILFAYTEKEHAFSDSEKHALIAAIDNSKILDPACGSGAFPMGILHKLEFILGKIDKNNRLWRDRQIDKVNATIAVAEQIDDATIRENTVKELEFQKEDIKEAFAHNDLGYGRKLYLIENCIYGVDIQSIATQVSKLRFFISLIVDQKTDPGKDNFGIRPLPNLETKFATADMLIQIEKPPTQGILFESAKLKELEKELKQIRHSLFNAKTPKTKSKYRFRDKELREQIAAELKTYGWGNASARQLAEWDPYDQNASASFFDPEWMFDLTGFDIVIGNPPYVQIQKFPTAQKETWIAQNYQTYAATADIYCLFYERGAQLLRIGGYLCYITSNKWMRSNYGKPLRKYFSTKVNTVFVFDFGMAQNFGAATTYTCILALERADSKKRTVSGYADDDRVAMADPESYFQKNAVHMPELGESAWVVVTPEQYRIKKAVEAQGVPLEEWDLNIYRGVLTGLNDAFYLTQEQRDELVAQEPQAEEIIVPLLRGRYVNRYKTDWDRTWLINAHNGVKEREFTPVNLPDDYPVLFDHLKQWKKKLIKRQDQGSHWTNLRNCAYIEEFRKPKVIYHEMSKHMTFVYDEFDHFFTNDTCYIATSETESLPYLTAIFNSHLFRCCFKDNFPEILGNTRRIKKVFMNKIPIKRADPTTAILFETLVDYIQFVKVTSMETASNDPPSAFIAAFLEELTDACVMEIYFADHMAEKKLSVITEVCQTIKPFPRNNSDSAKWRQVQSFYETVNAPKHPIRNRLMRIPIDSPDLLRVIKEEGKV